MPVFAAVSFEPDGDLAHRLLSPKHHVNKMYFARLDNPVTQEDVELFANGFKVDEELTAMPSKLEILKDSHCGAFAVIRLCCYFAAYFGLCGSVRFTPRAGLCWTLALVLERALSGFAVAAFPLAKDTGLAHTFATAADKQIVCHFLCGLSALLVLALTALGGGGLAAAALLALWRYYFVAKKQFGGITGDLAGWFLQRAELWMLAALAVSQWGGVL